MLGANRPRRPRMPAPTAPGEFVRTNTFVLAEIGGFTSFITDVGIEHDKEIVGHLLNVMFDARQSVSNISGISR